jgi:hypothetical protein
MSLGCTVRKKNTKTAAELELFLEIITPTSIQRPDVTRCHMPA